MTQKDVFYARFRGNGCITFLTLVKRYPPRGFKAQKAGHLVKKGRRAIDKWGKNTLPKNLIRTIKGGH